MSLLNLQYQTVENSNIDHDDAAIKVRALKLCEAHEAWEFHKQVRLTLPKEEKGFLQPKGAAYFKNYAAGKKGVLLGAFADVQLVGIVVVVKDHNLLGAHERGSITSPSARLLSQKYSSGPVCVLQAFCVCKNKISRGASSILLDACMRDAREQGSTHLFAQTAQANIKGITRFKKHGYRIVGSWEACDHARHLLYTPVQLSL